MPHRELNDRFKAHIARAARARRIFVTSVVGVCLLVGTGFAFEMIAPPNSTARASLANAFAAITNVLTPSLANGSDAVGSLSATSARVREQLAAASSLPWLDRLAANFYDVLCPILRNCAHSVVSITVANEKSLQPLEVPTVATSTRPLTQKPASLPIQQTVVTQPVIERIRETVRTVNEGGVNAAYVDARMSALSQSLLGQINAVAANAADQSTTIYQTLGAVARIENLDDVNITNATISGGTITGASISGTLTNAINSAVGTILDLTANTLTATNASTTNLTVSATTTTGGLNIASLDCSSLSNGGTLTTDASGNVVCAGDDGGGGGSVGGSNAQVQFNDSGSLGGDAGFTYNKTSDEATVGGIVATYATATNATSTTLFSTLGRFTSAIAATFSAVSATITNLTADTLIATNATTTRVDALDYVAIGRTATTTIRGSATSTFAAGIETTALNVTSSSATSTFANGISLASGCFGVNGVCLTQGLTSTAGDWTGTLGGFSAAQFIAAGFSTTSADYWETQQAARTADDLTNNSIEDLSDVAAITENYGDLFAWNGSTWADFATSTLAIALSDTTGILGATRGGTGLSSVSAAGILLGNYSGTGWQQLATSTLGLLTTHIAEGSNLYFTSDRFAGSLAGTTTDALAQGSTNRYYADSLAQAFIHASTTIPKTYTANAFTALQSFVNASSTLFSSNYASSTNAFFGNLSVGSLTGLLKATNGTVSVATPGSDYLTSANIFAYPFPNNATTTLLSFNGGASTTALSALDGFFVGRTSTTTILGNATSTFGAGIQTTALNVTSTAATSTFANGIRLSGGCFAAADGTCISGGSGSLTGTTGQLAYFSGTNTAVGTSSLFIATNGFIGIGTTTPPSGLSITANSIGTPSGAGVFIGTGASGTNGNVQINGTTPVLDFAGTSGIDYDFRQIFTSSSNTFSFNSSTTANILNITGTGNVGIGATSPTQRLTVTGTTTGQTEHLMKIGSASDNRYMKLGVLLSGDGNQRSFIQSYHTASDANTWDLLLNPLGGGVGIGTTSPSTKLHVSGTSHNDALGFIQAENTTAGSANSSITAKNFYGTSQFMQWESQGLRLGSRIATNGGGGNVNFTYGNDAVGMTMLGANGNVGIGTTTPSAKLDIYGNVGAISAGTGGAFIGKATGSDTITYTSIGRASDNFSKLRFVDKAFTTEYAGVGSDASSLQFLFGGAEKMRIDSSGNVGIGTASPSSGYGLTIDNTGSGHLSLMRSGTQQSKIYDDSSNVGVTNTAGTGVLLPHGNTSWSGTSDARLKTDVLSLASSTLGSVLALNPVTFTWRNTEANGTNTHVGFLAQDVAAVFPLLVSKTAATTTSTPDGTYVLDYTGLIPYLVEALKELASKVSETAHLVVDAITAHVGNFGRVNTDELCVDDVCVTRDEFLRMKEGQSAAAGASQLGEAETPGGSSASGAPDMDTTTDTATEAATSTQSDFAPANDNNANQSEAAEPEDEALDTLLLLVEEAPEAAASEAGLEASNDNIPPPAAEAI